ncbi:MAG: hypothetical protein ABFS35_11750 [Bacteroidota bacterium]
MFVSVIEAVELTGMSQTTIYRLCKKRSHTEYVKKEDNKYYIDKEYLLNTYPERVEDDLEIQDHQFGRTALNTPEDELIEFSDDPPTAIEENIIDDITAKITKKINTAELNSDNQKETNQQNLGTPWESIIGVSVGILLITGFILMLYFSSK